MKLISKSGILLIHGLIEALARDMDIFRRTLSDCKLVNLSQSLDLPNRSSSYSRRSCIRLLRPLAAQATPCDIKIALTRPDNIL